MLLRWSAHAISNEGLFSSRSNCTSIWPHIYARWRCCFRYVVSYVDRRSAEVDTETAQRDCGQSEVPSTTRGEGSVICWISQWTSPVLVSRPGCCAHSCRRRPGGDGAPSLRIQRSNPVGMGREALRGASPQHITWAICPVLKVVWKSWVLPLTTYPFSLSPPQSTTPLPPELGAELRAGGLNPPYFKPWICPYRNSRPSI